MTFEVKLYLLMRYLTKKNLIFKHKTDLMIFKVIVCVFIMLVSIQIFMNVLKRIFL